MNDFQFMKIAYQLALKGKGRTSPNPVVGAVLVKKGRVLAQGWHQRCGCPHAEVIAIKRARGKEKGAKLYVTLEPCYHQGRTPPCVDQIIKSKLREVIIGMRDPNPLTHGKSILKLRKAGIKTKVFHPKSREEAALKEDIEKMNEAFVKRVTTQMPFVVTKTAQTLDGKIATATGQSKWITAQQTRDYAHQLRNEFDAILVGINTVIKDNPGLNAARKSKRLKKIILDSALRISPRAKLFKNVLPSDCFIATTKNASAQRVASWQKKGVNVIVCPLKQGRVCLKWLLKELAKREITSVLIEGGAQTVGSALKERIVDKMLIFIAPKIMGSQKALSSIDGLEFRNVNQAVSLKQLEIKRIGKDFLIEGYL